MTMELKKNEKQQKVLCAFLNYLTVENIRIFKN